MNTATHTTTASKKDNVKLRGNKAETKDDFIENEEMIDAPEGKITGNESAELLEMKETLVKVETVCNYLSKSGNTMSKIYHDYVKPKKNNLRAVINELRTRIREEEEHNRLAAGVAKRGRKAKAAKAAKPVKGETSDIRKLIASQPGLGIDKLLEMVDLGVDNTLAEHLDGIMKPYAENNFQELAARKRRAKQSNTEDQAQSA